MSALPHAQAATTAASTRLLIPAPEGVGVLLRDLLGPTAVRRVGAPFQLASFPFVVTYEVGAQIGAVVVCDVAFAASAGAALSMLPACVVTEALRTKELSETLRENAFEVFNIGASLMNKAGGLHARCREMIAVRPGKLPPAVAALLAHPAERLDLEVTIKGSPPGKLAFLVCDLT